LRRQGGTVWGSEGLAGEEARGLRQLSEPGMGSSPSADGVTSDRLLLVTGCGRSGTKYTSFVLRRLGLDVPHERLGRDGVSAWTLAGPPADRPYGPRDVLRFEHVFHQVRHPLDAIASITTFGEDSWRYICAHTACAPDEPMLLRSARYWLAWNELVEPIATWRYRIESLPDVFPEFCRRLGRADDPSALARVPTDVNTRRRGRSLHLAEELLERLRRDMPASVRGTLGLVGGRQRVPPVRWDDIERGDEALAARLREKAREYGYAT
jgi:hypothetical protein